MAIAAKAAHVYCIEPDPKVFRALQKNTEALDNVTILQAAVSNETGTIDFYLSTEGAASSISTPHEYTEKIVINALSLDELVAKYKIGKVTFIKLEAEGWEPEVLLGATSTLKVCNRISIDAGPERGSSSTVEEVSAILISAGFNVQVTNNIVTATRTRGPC